MHSECLKSQSNMKKYAVKIFAFITVLIVLSPLSIPPAPPPVISI